MTKFTDLGKNYINGEWVEGLSERTYQNVNPYNQTVIAAIPVATIDQVREAYQAASTAQKEWAKSTPERRKEVLEKAAQYIKDHADDIVNMIIEESGGTILKGRVEVKLALEELEEATNMVNEIYTYQEVSSHTPGKSNRVYRLPLGVITCITPFNFHMNLGMRTIAPAIALGNALVHKADIQTGITGGSIIAKAFEEAGLPKGVFNSILTDVEEVGDEFLTNPHSDFISFTGSTPVGRYIAGIAGQQLKRVALELGGNSPFVVLSDADVDQAVDAAVFGKFVHNGQICMSINRIIVQKDCYDEFVSKFVDRVKALQVGDPKDPETVIGPVINEKQADKINNLITQAKQEGLKVALEGERRGNVIPPHIFVDVPNDSTLAQTELFGPVAQIVPAETDEEAIQLASETEYGLSSAIFTRDVKKGEQFAQKIEAGMTHINDQTVNDQANVMFGGTKASGIGRFGNPWIVEELTISKWVSVQSEYRTFPF